MKLLFSNSKMLVPMSIYACTLLMLSSYACATVTYNAGCTIPAGQTTTTCCNPNRVNCPGLTPPGSPFDDGSDLAEHDVEPGKTNDYFLTCTNGTLYKYNGVYYVYTGSDAISQSDDLPASPTTVQNVTVRSKNTDGASQRHIQLGALTCNN